MEANIQRTWKPTTAGILNIITGALSALTAIGMIIALIAVGQIDIFHLLPPTEASFITPLVTTIIVFILVLSIIEGILPQLLTVQG